MRNSLLTDNSLAYDVLTGNDETIDFDDILRGILSPNVIAHSLFASHSLHLLQIDQACQICLITSRPSACGLKDVPSAIST